MKLFCKLFGHGYKYYKKSGDDTLYRVCRCGYMSYKNKSTPGWVAMFLQAKNYKEKK